jgi:hypothetical protein
VFYAKAFFDLQLQFADKVASLTGMPSHRALLEYTNLYIRFGLGRDLDPEHAGWQEYLAGLNDAADRHEWTYRFYRARPDDAGAPPTEASFGCFSYARVGTDRIRLHFVNAETGRSPLGIESRGRRLADLATLFDHVKRTGNPPLQVAGASWLYNLEAYRRLFPRSYLANARPMPRRFQRMSLWGQFLDRRGEVRPDVTREFLARVERQSSVDNLDQCFPFQVLAVEAPVMEFFEFYAA